MPLTFRELRRQNLPRCRRWHPEGAPPWGFDEWVLALGGEVGEALNLVKKLNRDRDGLAGNTTTRAELIAQLGAELADVVIYLDICLGWDEPELLLCHVRSLHLADFAALAEVIAERQGDAAALNPTRRANILLADVASHYDRRGAAWALDVLWSTGVLAHAYGIDLGAAVVAKFNQTSERFGFPERLAA